MRLLPNPRRIKMTVKVLATNDDYSGLVTKAHDETSLISVLVKGVHCAVCIQKIESSLQSDPDVTLARLNFSTGKLNIEWKGEAANANHYVAKVRNLGYSVFPYSIDVEKSTAESESRFLLLCLGIAGFALGNIMLLSVGLWVTSAETMGEATRNLLHWVSALIAVPALIFAGRPFFISAWMAFKKKTTNMDVPISVAIILATGMSLFETVHQGEHVYFDSAVMLTFFLLIGRYLDFKARRNAKSAATDLMQTLSGFATIQENGQTKRVLIKELKEGMTILVALGEKIPTDSVLDSDSATIDTSLVTGETMPQNFIKGDKLYAGMVNISAPLKATVSKAAEDSLLAEIIRLMEKAEQGQAKFVRIADKAAQLYTPLVHSLAFIAFLIWWLVIGVVWQDALLIAITVLIITCPCALGLAVPVVQVLASGLLLKKGVLVKSGDALERLASIDTAFFDKTGTLTYGTPMLVGEYHPDTLLIASSLAAYSAHPVAQALQNKTDNLMSFENIKEYEGQGVEAKKDGITYRLGSREWCGDKGTKESDAMELWLSIYGAPTQCFLLEDIVKKDAHSTIEELKSYDVDTVLISGDRVKVAERIAQDVGMETVYAQKNPVDKHGILESFRGGNRKILMVGDGLNDAPVLSAADVSMAPGTALDIAQNAADIIFQGKLLSPVSFTYKIALRTRTLIKQNFALAVIYNAIAIPLAFMGLVTPMIAAIAMSGSSLLVIANSYKLKLLT